MRPALLASLALCACAAAPASAEMRATAGNWRYELSGYVNDHGRLYDFQRDLELEIGGRRSVLLELDTGPGWWPDWTASFSKFGAAGDHEETFQPMVGGVPVGPPQTQTIAAAANFDDFDLAAQYPFAVGRLRCSLGVAVKRLRGTLRIEDSEQDETLVEDYDQTFPELRGQVRWPLARWLTLVGALQGVSYAGNQATEWRATAEIAFKALLLEAGWQVKAYQIDVGGYAMDAELDGALVRGGFVWR